MRLSVCYTMPDIHCRDRRYEWEGGINAVGYNGRCLQQANECIIIIIIIIIIAICIEQTNSSKRDSTC